MLLLLLLCCYCCLCHFTMYCSCCRHQVVFGPLAVQRGAWRAIRWPCLSDFRFRFKVSILRPLVFCPPLFPRTLAGGGEYIPSSSWDTDDQGGGSQGDVSETAQGGDGERGFRGGCHIRGGSTKHRPGLGACVPRQGPHRGESHTGVLLLRMYVFVMPPHLRLEGLLRFPSVDTHTHIHCTVGTHDMRHQNR